MGLTHHHQARWIARITLLPIGLVLVAGLASYALQDRFDELLCALFIDKIFIPLYLTLFGVIFSFCLNPDLDDELMRLYKKNLRFISLCVVVLLALEVVFQKVL